MNVSTPIAIQHPIIKAAHERAVTLPPNTVQVWPGGAKFTTIMDAINSIQGATPDEQYQVIIGSGTYNEIVWMKDNVFLSGAGQDLTVISWNQNGALAGALCASGNCGAGMLTVNGQASAATPEISSLYISMDGTTFSGEGLNINASDGGIAGVTAAGVTNNAGANTCTVTLASCNINSSTTGSGSVALGIQMVAAGCSMSIELSTITATSPTSVGLITAAKASAVLNGCTITGTQYALSNDDQQSPVTANGCTINGPVTPGVIVNPS